MPEILQESHVLLKPKNHKSRLDHEFPTGAVLLCLVGIVFFSQGISAWKVMNLEHEKAALEADKRQYAHLKLKLPQLLSQKETLREEVLNLEGQAESLSIRQNTLQESVKTASSTAEELKIKIESSHTKIDELSAQYKERQKAMEDVSLQHKRLSDEVNSLDSRIKGFRLEITTTESQLNDLKKEEKQKESSVARLEAREEELNKLRSGLADILKDLKTDTVNFQTTNQEVTENLNTSIRSLDDAQQSIRTSQTKWDQQISGIQAAGAQTQEILARFNTEITELQKKRSELNNLQKSLEDMLSKLQGAEESAVAINKSIPIDIKGLKNDLLAALQQLKDLNSGQTLLQKQISEVLKAKTNSSEKGR
mgnify:CR=1 FL=1